MVVSTNERTLISALIPPGPGHIDTVFSIAFENAEEAFQFGWLCCSLPYDFFVRTTGKTHFRRDLADLLPWPDLVGVEPFAIPRIAALTCVTQAYEASWNQITAHHDRISLNFSKEDPRLKHPRLTRAWSLSTPLRTDYIRRQALVELDALAALVLGLTE